MQYKTIEILKICPICGHDSSYKLTTDKFNYKIFACDDPACSHFFYPDFYQGQGVDKREEDVSKESDETLTVFKKRNSSLLKFFLKNINSSKPYTFLDFGSGVAHISRTFLKILKESVEIICFEPNKNLKGFYDKFSMNQIYEIDRVDKSYDLIYMIEVAEHLDNPKEVFKKLSYVMDNNTKLFITTPRATFNPSGDCYDNPSHIHFFTNNSLNRLLESVGLKKMKFLYVPEMYVFDSKGKYYLEKLKSFIINPLISNGISVNYQFKNHLVGFTELK